MVVTGNKHVLWDGYSRGWEPYPEKLLDSAQSSQVVPALAPCFLAAFEIEVASSVVDSSFYMKLMSSQQPKLPPSLQGSPISSAAS